MSATNSHIHAEYQKRAERCAELVERSKQMERDFLEKKVLNHQANEALDAACLEKRLFSLWLLDNHAELFSVSETGTRNDALEEADNAMREAKILGVSQAAMDRINVALERIRALKNADTQESPAATQTSKLTGERPASMPAPASSASRKEAK